MYYWWYPDWNNGRAYPGRSPESAECGQDQPVSGHEIEADGDRRLERAVASALLHDPAVRGGHIDLSVQNGVVILDGEVDSESVRSAAGTRAWSVAGVMDVCDALTVKKRRFRLR
jgi:osmotically-inducible protein OsmY